MTSVQAVEVVEMGGVKVKEEQVEKGEVVHLHFLYCI